MMNVLIEALSKNLEKRKAYDLKQIVDSTKDIEDFKRIYEEHGSKTFEAVCHHMTYEHFDKDTYVIRQGTTGNKFYIILRGKVSVEIKQPYPVQANWLVARTVATLQAGKSFGDLALLRDQPRNASILCLSECDFAVLEKSDYKKFLASLSDLKLENLMIMLRRHIMFDGMGQRGLEKLSYFFHHRNYFINQTVYREGDKANELFLIKNGSFKLTKIAKIYGKKRQIDIGILGKGEVFGEEDLIDRADLRTLNAICISPSAEVTVIPREEFLKRLAKQPEVAKAEKLKKAHRQKRIQKMISTFQNLSLSPGIDSPKDTLRQKDIRLLAARAGEKFHSTLPQLPQCRPTTHCTNTRGRRSAQQRQKMSIDFDAFGTPVLQQSFDASKKTPKKVVKPRLTKYKPRRKVQSSLMISSLETTQPRIE